MSLIKFVKKMVQKTKSPNREGEIAYYAGENISACPYMPGSKDYYEWRAGYLGRIVGR